MFRFVERGYFSIMIAMEDDDEMRVQKVKNYGASRHSHHNKKIAQITSIIAQYGVDFVRK